MSALDWTSIEGPQDIRLVVADMDGTLLDGQSRIPEGFWQMMAKLRAAGVEFVPASGRQYATLCNMFAEKADGLSYIAENGNVVAVDGVVVETHGVDVDVTRRVIDLVDDAVQQGRHDIGMVICGLKTAYIQRDDDAFVAECGKYYAALKIVPDLHDVLDGIPEQDAILKLAIFDFGDVESTTSELFLPLANDYQVVVSGAHWVDIMDKNVDKKQGVLSLQRHLGVTPAQTAVFGDYLNDLEMLEAGEWSFAMGNAHPRLKESAHYIAPTNIEHGVLQVVDRLVG